MAEDRIKLKPEKESRISYYLDRAATALDCAMQLCSDENSLVINHMEETCDKLAKEYKVKGN